jgi:ribosome-binding factor A
MSHRPEQLNAALHRAVQSVIARGLNDPRIRGLVSVTKVKMSPDKRTAAVFVSVLPAERSSAVLHGLRSAAAHIRTKIGDAVNMRRLPTLEFELDESLKKEAAVLAAIQRGLEKSADAAPDAEADDAYPDADEHGSGERGPGDESHDQHEQDQKEH